MTPIQEVIEKIDKSIEEAIKRRDEFQKRLDKHKKMFSWYKNQYIMHHIDDVISKQKLDAQVFTLQQAKKLAESQLQAEREAIENAYNAGYSEGCNTIDPEGRKYKNAEDYFNKTFNQSK
jgi:septal ring factor EnvC (AmiA/AmiB activator)